VFAASVQENISWLCTALWSIYRTSGASESRRNECVYSSWISLQRVVNIMLITLIVFALEASAQRVTRCVVYTNRDAWYPLWQHVLSINFACNAYLCMHAQCHASSDYCITKPRSEILIRCTYTMVLTCLWEYSCAVKVCYSRQVDSHLKHFGLLGTAVELSMQAEAIISVRGRIGSVRRIGYTGRDLAEDSLIGSRIRITAVVVVVLGHSNDSFTRL